MMMVMVVVMMMMMVMMVMVVMMEMVRTMMVMPSEAIPRTGQCGPWGGGRPLHTDTPP